MPKLAANSWVNQFMNKSICSDDMFSFLWRFIVNSVLVWSVLGLYLAINYHPPDAPAVVRMPSWMPFWPVFTVPYLAMLLVTWLLPLAIRDVGRFFACWFGMFFAYIVVIILFLSFPTTLPRPPVPDGWCAGLYRGLIATDPPNNVMPCAHGIGAMVAAWFTVYDRPTWRWPLVGVLVLGLSSVALISQHRPIDIALGTIIGVIGIAVGEALNRSLRQVVAKIFSRPA
jgi:hypothetical protein